MPVVPALPRRLSLVVVVAATIAPVTASPALAADPPMFAPFASYPVGGGATQTVVLELNGDNKPDTVTGGSNTFTRNFGVGDGTLVGTGSPATPVPGDSLQGVASADTDGDDDLDFILVGRAGPSSGSVNVYLSEGTGNPFASGGGSTPNPISAVDVGLINSDDDPDLVVTEAGADLVRVLYGGAGASFTAAPTGGVVSVGDEPRSVALADLNSDGHPDIVAGSATTGSVSVALGSAAGYVGTPTTVPVSFNASIVTVGDLDGDGAADLLVGGSSSTISVFAGHGDGTFGTEEHLPITSETAGVHLADLNGDGDLDLVWTYYDGNTVNVRLGAPGRTFGPAVAYPVGSGPSTVVAQDMNGDLNPDLVVTSPGSSTISVLLNTPPSGGHALLSPGSHPFGIQAVDTDSGVRTFNLINNGTSALNVSTVELTGVDADQFAITDDDCTGAAPLPGDKCNVSVQFSPTSSGRHSATLEIGHAAGVARGAVSGIGTAPVFQVSPTTKAYGDQLAGTTSTPQTFTVTNTGDADLDISSAALGGTDPTQFTPSDNTCAGASLAPTQTCSVTVAFAPTTAGDKSAKLSFTDNASGSPHDVTLTGTGTAPSFSVSPTSKAYGDRLVGSSAAQTFTVTNTGTGQLTMLTAGVIGTDVDQFTPSANSCIAVGLAPTQTCQVTVTFVPTSVGPKLATLRFTDSAAGSPHDVALTGTGTASGFQVSPAVHGYGSRTVGTTTGQTFSVTNTGNAPLDITSASLSGADVGQFNVPANGCSSVTLAPTQTCSVTVAFAPTSIGAKSATLTFTDGAAGSPHAVALSGTGTAVVPPTPTATCQGKKATIVGTTGNDKLNGTSGADVIAGLGGNDKIKGLGGNDLICAGDGNDKVDGGDGNDKLYGDAGTDKLTGGAGKDTCRLDKGEKAKTCEKLRGPGAPKRSTVLLRQLLAVRQD